MSPSQKYEIWLQLVRQEVTIAEGATRQQVDRSTIMRIRTLAKAGVRRVPFLADKHFRPLPRPGKSVRRPFPAWVSYTPHSIWIFDPTHFTRAGIAVLIIEDLVSRKWITEIVSSEETHTQVELGFTIALAGIDRRVGQTGRR